MTRNSALETSHLKCLTMEISKVYSPAEQKHQFNNNSYTLVYQHRVNPEVQKLKRIT